MLKKTYPSKEAQSADREECYVCYRAKKNCLCGSIKPFATKMRFVILMHTKEDRRQKTGTARLAKLCLKNSELLIGTDFTRNERVNALLGEPAYSPFVLFPGPEAVNFKTMGGVLPAGKTPLVFVIDGTWECARRLLNRSKNIRALPRLSFSRSYTSQFAIKKQPMEHCISTIEALYYLCEEAKEAGYEDLGGRSENLMEVFKKLVGIQLEYSKGKGKRGSGVRS
jgi:DTW domain-containing protein YfiP